jgi:5-methylcytosine-specific restriction endonuclease McrBC regulatory subunit McrC
MGKETLIRLCEWSELPIPYLPSAQRRDIAGAVETWREANHLPEPPLWFSGPEGKTLNARQYVGVIELQDIIVEVYPKLDRHLLKQEVPQDEEVIGSVMSDLLWMLDVSGHLDVSEVDQAGLKEFPGTFYDVFALLLAKHLLSELLLGLPHAYMSIRDDVRTVRGKVCIADQLARNMNRCDLVSCEWDEFTADTPMNQLLKCSCRLLVPRVHDDASRKALLDCIQLYDRVSDLHPLTALLNASHHRWDRRTERFRTVFELAVRLLQGTSHVLASADTSTFVFLIDMNKLFEKYVKTLLEAYFDVCIIAQKQIGFLFPQVEKGKIAQLADYFWLTKDGTIWIGDAKYKHLTESQSSSLSFTQIHEEDPDSIMPAGRILAPSDVRQLTVYAELVRERHPASGHPNILFLYPFVGEHEAKCDATEAWNGSTFILCPVRTSRQNSLKNALPSDLYYSGIKAPSQEGFRSCEFPVVMRACDYVP